MWRRGKKRNDDERPAGWDSDSAAVEEARQISKNRRVSVRNWQGKIVVDIREFYVKGKIVCFPGRSWWTSEIWEAFGVSPCRVAMACVKMKRWWRATTAERARSRREESLQP